MHLLLLHILRFYRRHPNLNPCGVAWVGGTVLVLFLLLMVLGQKLAAKIIVIVLVIIIL